MTVRRSPWMPSCFSTMWIAILVACSSTSTACGQDEVALPAAEMTGRRILVESDCHGGLIVLAGCTDGELAVSLGEAPNVLVQALVSDLAQLEAVRTQVREAGLYGRVSANYWNRPILPYADGMVNVLLAFPETKTLDRSEIERVLAPLGTAWIDRGGKLTSYRKPWPDEIDQWSHSRYDSTGNAVSKDKLAGPPRFLQWEALPRWNRGVKTSGLLSTRGRLFYILDDSHFAARNRTWSLIARDANNGVRLWRRELASWGGSRGGKKVGPAQINRRLVASEKNVFVTLEEFAPVSMLDPATGETVRTFEQTNPTEEFVLSNGTIVALVNPNTKADHRRGKKQDMRIVAVDPESGKVLWEHAAPLIMPMTVAADAKQVVFHDGRSIQSLALKTGIPNWTSPPTGQEIEYRSQSNPDAPGAEKGTIVLAPQFAPTLIIYDDVVAFAGGRQLNVVSTQDGTELWRSDYAASNYSVPVDLFGFKGCLWGPDADMNLWRPLDDNLDYNAYNPRTGKVEKTVAGKYGFRFQHHRCHQMKVVDNKVVAARAGIEFLDTDTGDLVHHHWTRGSCYYGVLPANGRLYTPPHDCACYVRAKLSGFLAMNASAPSRSTVIPDDRRLQRGPAYGQTETKTTGTGEEDWPTYRHDNARSGRVTTNVGQELLLGWQTGLGGKLTAPVIADNRVYLASTDTHTLYAVDAMTGEVIWQSTFEARIDSPPTIDEGLVLCGCRDGSVHALREKDGQLVWRFMASPEERFIVSRGQLESVWPVHGSILVANGLAYFAAGRSSYLDGGLRLYGLEPRTGKKVIETVLSTLGDDSSEVLDDEGVDGFLNDILSSDGQRIFMRHQVLDLTGKPKAERVSHLHGADGYLSADTTNRLQWSYAPVYTSPHQGAFYDLRLSRVLYPSGRILIEDGNTIFGYGQNRFDKPISEPGGQWALFSMPKKTDVPPGLSAKEYLTWARSGNHAVSFHWWQKVPIHVRAIVRTKDILFAAGPPGTPLTTQAALDGKSPATLLAISPSDGSILSEMALPSTPVWDGMAAADGNLYLSLANGEIVCLWDIGSGRPGKPLSPAAWRAALPPLELAEEPGLVGRWRFDEGVGMLARDCSGKGHDAEVSSAWGHGDFGTCLIADGNPNAAVIPDHTDFHFGNDDFTLAFWVKIEAHGARLLGKEAFPENWWVINLLDDGRAELVLGEGRGPNRSARVSTTESLSTGSWSHLVAIVDRQAAEIRWYLNGKPSGNKPIPEEMTAGIHAAGQTINIPSAHKPFRGLIGDFRIYRKALAPDGARDLYHQEAPDHSSAKLHVDG